MSEYNHSYGCISQQFILSEQHKLQIVAKDTRRERTGIHAAIEIKAVDEAGKNTLLAWSTFNVGRETDRKAVAVAAMKHLPDKYKDFPLKHHIDDFCIGLWDESLRGFSPEDMCGAAHLEAPVFILKPFIVNGGGTILFGPPGRGKSQTLLLMAQSVHKGVDKLWTIPYDVPDVLFLNLERSGMSIAQRLARVNMFLGLPQTERLWSINARGRTLAEVAPAAKKFIQEHEVGLLVVDSLSRTGFGSMKDDEDVNSAMDCLNSLCPTWLAAGHSSRADDSHVFGSQMYDAAADVIVQLSSQVGADGVTLGVRLTVTKINDGGRIGYTDTLAYEYDELGFVNARGARSFEFPELNASKSSSPLDNIKAFVDEKRQATASQIGKALKMDISNVSKLIRDNPDFELVEGGKGNEKLYALKA